MSDDAKESHQPKLRLTDMTLAEQMKITERDIADRKALMGFTEEDAKYLVAAKDTVIEHLDEIVGVFYDRQTSFPEIQLLIGDAETFNRLHSSMKRYVMELFEGFYDEEYVNKRLRIGKVHKRIGVSPKLYISAIYHLEEAVLRYVTDPSKQDTDCVTCSGVQGALHKLLSLDVQFVFDTYIASLVSEVEAAKAQVEEYAEGVEETVAERTRQLEELSRRDKLTGLFNQRSFYEQLRRELSVAERNQQVISLVYFDLNSFKKLNDEKGHRAGDALLEAVGKATEETVRDIDIACRYGGDEFCVIMPGTAVDQAEVVSGRLIANFDKRPTEGVSFSIGIAQLGPEKFTDMDSFVKMADKRMYEAKAKSKKDPGHHICVESA